MAIDPNLIATGAVTGGQFGPTGAAIGAGLGLLGGFLGAGAASGDREGGFRLTQEMLDEYNNLSVPDKASLVAHLQRYSSAGKLDPRLEEAILMGPSAIETTGSDPRLVAQQMSNLQEMQKIAEAGGYDPTIKNDLMDALRRQEQSARANQEALRMQAESRGMASAGATQALQQMASQSEANRTAEIQSKLAAAAYQNRLAALAGASGEAGRLRASDYQEQLDKAKARDLINEFNTRTKQSTQTTNIGAQNRAQDINLTRDQDILNKNVGLTNAEEESRINAEKERHRMELDKLVAKSGAAGIASAGLTARGNRTASQIQGGFEGAAGLAAALNQINKDKKKDDTGIKESSTVSTADNYTGGRYGQSFGAE